MHKLSLHGEGPTASGYRLWLGEHEITDATRAVRLNMSVSDVNTVTIEVYVDRLTFEVDADVQIMDAKGPERTSLASRIKGWFA